MKKISAMIALCAVTGCTSVPVPWGGEYKNGMFNKQFSKMSVSQTMAGTNGVSTNLSISIDGWQSDLTQNLKAMGDAINAALSTAIASAAKASAPVPSLAPAQQ